MRAYADARGRLRVRADDMSKTEDKLYTDAVTHVNDYRAFDIEPISVHRSS